MGRNGRLQFRNGCCQIAFAFAGCSTLISGMRPSEAADDRNGEAANRKRQAEQKILGWHEADSQILRKSARQASGGPVTPMCRGRRSRFVRIKSQHVQVLRSPCTSE